VRETSCLALAITLPRSAWGDNTKALSFEARVLIMDEPR
jgi:hypothetical protein